MKSLEEFFKKSLEKLRNEPLEESPKGFQKAALEKLLNKFLEKLVKEFGRFYYRILVEVHENFSTESLETFSKELWKKAQ